MRKAECRKKRKRKMKKWIVKDLVNGVYAKSMSGDYTKGLVNLMLKQNGENTTFIDITSPDGDSIGVTCGYSFSYRCMQYDVDGDTYNDVNDAMGSIAYRIDMIAEQLETYIVMKEWRAFETEEFWTMPSMKTAWYGISGR